MYCRAVHKYANLRSTAVMVDVHPNQTRSTFKNRKQTAIWIVLIRSASDQNLEGLNNRLLLANDCESCLSEFLEIVCPKRLSLSLRKCPFSVRGFQVSSLAYCRLVFNKLTLICSEYRIIMSSLFKEMATMVEQWLSPASSTTQDLLSNLHLCKSWPWYSPLHQCLT